MKKIFLFFLSTSFLFCASVGYAEKKEKPVSKYAVYAEGMTMGSILGGVSFVIPQLLSKIKVVDGDWKRDAGIGVAGLLIGLIFDVHYGYSSRYTESAHIDFIQALLTGKGLSDPKLLNLVLKFVQKGAVDLINDLIDTYGFEEADKQLDNLQKETMKAYGHSFKLSEFSGKNFETQKEQRKKIMHRLTSIKNTRHLIRFKKRIHKANRALNIEALKNEEVDLQIKRVYKSFGQENISGKLALRLGEIEYTRDVLVKEKENLPFKNIFDEEFEDFLNNASLTAKKLKKVKHAVDADQAFKKAQDVLNSTGLIDLMREHANTSPSYVIDESKKFSCRDAVEDLEALGTKVKNSMNDLTKHVDIKSSDEFKKLHKIHGNIQIMTKRIKSDRRYNHETAQYLEETRVKSRLEAEKNKGLSIKKDKKRFKSETQKLKIEQARYQVEMVSKRAEIKRLEKEKTKLEKELQTEKVSTAVAFTNQLAAQTRENEERGRAQRERERASRAAQEEYEAKLRLEQAAQLNKQQSETLSKCVQKTNANTRAINTLKKEVKENKKKTESNEKILGGLSEQANQVNNPGTNPECE